MWTHTLREAIPTRDLLLAVTDPDDTGARWYIARVRHHHLDGWLVTDVSYLPLPTIPVTRLESDVDGSLWIDPSVIKLDADGAAQVLIDA